MIRSLYRSSNGELSEGLEPDQLREALRDPGGTVWLDIVHLPAKKEQIGILLREVFPFHPLALDDALQETHVPRIDDWGEYLYIVLHALDLEVNRTLDTHELDLFLGPNYLITIRDEPVEPLNRLWDQCRQGRDRSLKTGPDHLLYALADAIVGDYMAVVDGLDEEIDELEDAIFQQPTPRTVSRIFRLRRTVLRLRRMLGYLREVFNRLTRDEFPVIDAADRVYFRDVYDHLVRMYDIVEGLRDMVGGALDSYLSVTSNRINEVMRTLTVVTVLFMPISFLSGFFGMNFFGEAFNVENPFRSTVLFWLCAAVIVLLPPAMLWWMARRGWLSSLRMEKEAREMTRELKE
jgi:magnesium transporter